MKYIKRILILFSFFLFYFIIKEFIILYHLAYQVNPYLAYVILGLISLFIIILGIFPFIRIMFMKNKFSPSYSSEDYEFELQKRVDFYKNKFINELSQDDFTGDNEKDYALIVGYLKQKSNLIRTRYATQLFVSTGISQNGFIDAILIFSASVNIIKEIFILHQNRASFKDVLIILKHVYFSMAIGGSESVEYAVEEMFQKLAAEGLKNIPFLDKFITSIADGFINSAFLIRVALITENYCQKIYIENKGDLYPSYRFILSTTKHIVKGSINVFRNDKNSKGFWNKLFRSKDEQD